MSRIAGPCVLAILAAGACLAACGSTSARQSEPRPVAVGARARPCVSIERLRRSEIVDNQTIRLHLIDGVVIRSRLPQPCYGLLMQGGFGFVSSTAQLCEMDLIRVIGAGSVCKLGTFEFEGPATDAGSQPVPAE